MGEQLTIEKASGEHPNQRVVRLGGRLSIETVPAFLKSLRMEAAPIVILDLSGLTYVDSAGVGALIQVHAGYEKIGQRLALAAVPPRVDAVLDVARVARVFRIFSSVNTAAESLA